MFESKKLLILMLIFLILCIMPTKTYADDPKIFKHNWYISETTDPMTDQKTIVFSNPRIGYNESYRDREMLFFRYKNGEFEILFLVSDGILDFKDEFQVKYRIDKETPKIVVCGRGTHYDVLFFRNPINLIKSLYGKSRLVIEYPMRGYTKQFEVNLTGVDDVIKYLMQECNLK